MEYVVGSPLEKYTPKEIFELNNELNTLRMLQVIEGENDTRAARIKEIQEILGDED